MTPRNSDGHARQAPEAQRPGRRCREHRELRDFPATDQAIRPHVPALRTSRTEG